MAVAEHTTPYRGTLDISAKSKNDCEGKTGKYLYLYLPYLPYTFPSPSSCWTHLEIGDNLAGSEDQGRPIVAVLRPQHGVHSMEVLDHHLSRPFPDDGSMQPQRQNVRRKSQGPPFLHTPRCCIVVLINITFTDSNMVHRHSAGAPQPSGKGRKTDCWLLAAGWSLGNVAVAVRSGTAHHPRRFVAYTGCGLPMLPDDSPFSWVGVAYPYLTLPWEIGGGLFLFLSYYRFGRTRAPRDDYVISDVSHLVRGTTDGSPDEPGIGAVISHGAGIGTWDDDQAQSSNQPRQCLGSLSMTYLALSFSKTRSPSYDKEPLAMAVRVPVRVCVGRSQNSGYYSRIRTQYTHSGISKMKARNARWSAE
ncbi:uncharacterized protein CLUP02_02187 [Colletotrichum lupini]|uniref:Uncharacterized protein n=1 Tax=Colletotrichum lupini TaxID=145971 RepID=A0A9Q8W9E1_9PEZI|nr:uncharacterized protein CLUP02_02187 [Colletotrichum lupini]UQC75533.1 hypothetical protein CLUP02_02187 [Colletotrichum lupini]